ncbi:MAG TPA: hypothetical protein VF974_08315 [Patescibacteria group bacterium]
MNEKQVRAFILFSDISGYGAFWRRISHLETELYPFQRQWRELVKDFREKTGYFVKRMGDGVLAIKEIRREENVSSEGVNFLNNSWVFTKDVYQLVENKSSPRPDGFRTRISLGYIVREPDDQLGWDYVGDKINLTEKMIHFYRSETMVCHESVKELFSEKQLSQNHFSFKKLIARERRSADIYSQDMKSLWTFKKNGKL